MFPRTQGLLPAARSGALNSRRRENLRTVTPCLHCSPVEFSDYPAVLLSDLALFAAHEGVPPWHIASSTGSFSGSSIESALVCGRSRGCAHNSTALQDSGYPAG